MSLSCKGMPYQLGIPSSLQSRVLLQWRLARGWWARPGTLRAESGFAALRALANPTFYHACRWPSGEFGPGLPNAARAREHLGSWTQHMNWGPYSAGHAKSTKMLACEPKSFQKNKVQICVQGGWIRTKTLFMDFPMYLLRWPKFWVTIQQYIAPFGVSGSQFTMAATDIMARGPTWQCDFCLWTAHSATFPVKPARQHDKCP